jgi:hypothetical protein
MGGELLLDQLGTLLRRPRHRRGAGRLDLSSVLVSLLAGHAGDDAPECDLDIVERMTIAVRNLDVSLQSQQHSVAVLPRPT